MKSDRLYISFKDDEILQEFFENKQEGEPCEITLGITPKVIDSDGIDASIDYVDTQDYYIEDEDVIVEDEDPVVVAMKITDGEAEESEAEEELLD